MARVMVVDDVATVREIVAAILERKGHRVVQASSGEQALADAASRKLHLVITDVNMPGMDGIDFVTRLRRLDLHARTPVLVLAKGAKDEHVARARDAGAVGWIAKPFTEDSLVATVNEVLVDFYVN